MSEWAECTFCELFAVPSRNGLTRPSAVRGAGYKMINMGELFANDRIGDIPMERVQMNERELANMLVQEGDLLFARQSLVLAGAGRCVIVNDVNEPTTFESHLIRVRLDQEKADSRFYRYYFASPLSAIKSIVKQGVQAGIKGSDLQKLSVHCPPLPIQRRIADILSAYDDLIENNRRRIEILEETARTLYRKMFGSVTNATAMLSDLADVVMGQSPESKTYNSDGEGLPFHQGVTGFGDRFPTNELWCTAGTRFAQAGDILFSVRAPVGRINLCQEKIVIGRGLSAMRSKRGYQSWLLYALKSYFSKEDMIGVGCIFASTTKKELLGVKLPCPSDSEILAFESQARPIDEQISNLAKQNAKLAAARDLLLPRLMSGKLSVFAAEPLRRDEEVVR